MFSTTTKGDIAEQKIICDLLEYGFKIAKPISHDSPFDLIAYRDNHFYRVQCKYSTAVGHYIHVRCRRTGQDCVTYYTQDNIEWLANYDSTTDTCYYLPSTLLGGTGRNTITLRINSANTPHTTRRTRWAHDYRHPPTDLPHTSFSGNQAVPDAAFV